MTTSTWPMHILGALKIRTRFKLRQYSKIVCASFDISQRGYKYSADETIVHGKHGSSCDSSHIQPREAVNPLHKCLSLKYHPRDPTQGTDEPPPRPEGRMTDFWVTPHNCTLQHLMCRKAVHGFTEMIQITFTMLYPIFPFSS